MTLKKRILVVVLLPLAALAGCDSNPTNEPSQTEIDQAKKDQIAAIDKDLTMSAQDKENLKRAKGFVPGGPPGSEGTKGR